jgi:transcriptional/translational regulatory protein YebC/TACO1
MLELALEVGADECVTNDDGHEFIAGIESFASVRDALEAKLGAPLSSGMVWRAQNTTAVKDDVGETLVKLIETLDDNDDVQNVYGNYALSDALMEKLAG